VCVCVCVCVASGACCGALALGRLSVFAEGGEAGAGSLRIVP